MKCDKCNIKEANVYYKSTVNGMTTEMHLCAECAMEEGLVRGVQIGSGLMFDGVLGGFIGMRPEMLPGFVSFGGFGHGIKAPNMNIPKIELITGADVLKKPAREIFIPADAGDEIKSKRELTALKYQLDAAVKVEDFEKAAEIRDRIRDMEIK